ncbi:MAG: hypothetical protein ACREHG_10015 [Candidatus Saccharimonadales bacterium]
MKHPVEDPEDGLTEDEKEEIEEDEELDEYFNDDDDYFDAELNDW